MCFRKTIKNYEKIFKSVCNARVSIFELFVHYKGSFLVNHRQSPRQGVKMAEGNCVGCESITKYVCLKCDAFACNRSLKCSVPTSENYPGRKECTRVAWCFKCDKEEHATHKEMTETPDDAELVIQYQKIWSPKFEQKLNIKCDTYLMHMLWDFVLKSQEKLKVLLSSLSSDIFLEKYSDFVNIS